MFQFGWPWVFALLPLPWLMRYLLPPVATDNEGVIYAPFAMEIAAEGARRVRAPNRWRQFFALLIWLLLVVAAARPQWLGEPRELPQTGRNLMLALDVSGSMESPDLDSTGGQISRLEVVKAVAGRFIERREGDRIGLILFGTQAYLQAPLTFDRETVSILLEESVIGLAGRETAIGDAIGLGIKRLREAPEGKAVLILLTDGANTAGSVAPRRAAELASQAGLRIYTIGVGADAMLVDGFFGQRMINPSADLDEATLKMIAETTGGQYYRAMNRAELEAIYTRLDEEEPVTGGGAVVRPVAALYYWPLGAAMILSLLLALPGAGFGIRGVSP